MKRKLFLSFTIFALFSIITVNAQQDWKKHVNSQKKGSFPLPKPVQLTYSASFNGVIKAGKISFIFGKKDKRYPQYFICQSYGGSSLAALPYKYDLTSFTSPKTLYPKLLVANEHDKKESVKIFNKYSSKSVSHEKTTTLTGSKTPEIKKHTFSGVPIHDPLSAMLYLRSQKLNVGDKVHMCIHPFSSAYYCVVTVLGKEKLNGKDSIKIDVGLRKIDRKTGNLTTYKKLKKATIWLTDDNQRIPLEFKIDVKIANILNIGSVKLKLSAQQKP